MRVLIIEDNKQLAKNIKIGLESKNYSIDMASNGTKGEELAFVNDYDVILLDLNLPDKDGIEILKFLRGEDIFAPVIIISARDEILDKTQGLNLGADDYITKPFHISELEARIQAVTRRFNGRTNPIINVGLLGINPMTREAIYDHKIINLSSKEFDILEYIAQKHPKVVSSEEILEHVYDSTFDSFSSVLRVHLTRIRKKIRSVAGLDILITIRGKGYKLCEK